jgi:2-polyprenyl-6-methoxyphenol hydroxylase-like FAD-dependent oxidoreductase
MQFFLNGFKPGDPRVAAALSPARPEQFSGHTDVLIVGSGPTGLTLASQLAAFPDIETVIVEQKAGPLQMGQADGIACRTLEMFEAFGFSERVLKESYWVNETSFWRPDPTRPANIIRSRVIQDVEDGISEFPHVILNQARVHDFFLELMSHSPKPLEPRYSRRLIDLQCDPSLAMEPSAYPVTARFEHVEGPNAGKVEEINARYVVGCDGARSAVRPFIHRPLEGASSGQAWGVMDVLALTNFPDIRRKTAIHSAEAGSLLIIPREGGYLVRFYIELDQLASGQRAAELQVTTEQLIERARKILHPYTLQVKEIAWSSVYEIGQRLSARFDDLADTREAGRFPRCFIAGDACHTHSPKAGQGMNVSMQDAFNLGWKLAAVVRGRATPKLLRTYSDERHAVAKELIDFDEKFAQMFAAHPSESSTPDGKAVDPADFQAFFQRQGRFTAGVATRYGTSKIVGPDSNQHLAKGFTLGMRLHSAPVVRVSDAKRTHLGHTVRADGRWRIFAFADTDSPATRSSRLWRLCDFLEQSPDSPVRKYTPVASDIDSVIEVIAICQQAHAEVSIEALPPVLIPRKGRYGLIDYEKLYGPDLAHNNDIFDLRGIDRKRGALVIVRPDQHIAHVLPLDGYHELSAFFAAFMRKPLPHLDGP